MDQNPKQSEDQPTTYRLVRPSVVVLCGPAGCGKTTFAARHFRPTQVLSADRARALVCDDEGDRRFQTQTFALLHFLIEQRLGLNRLCVVDSTALTQQARRSILHLARKHGVPCVAFLFDVPIETCAARDQARERSLGRATIDRHYELFERVKVGISQEGFDQIIALGCDDLENLRIEVVFRPVPRTRVSPPRAVPSSPKRSFRHPRSELGDPGTARSSSPIGTPTRPDEGLSVTPPASQGPASSGPSRRRTEGQGQP